MFRTDLLSQDAEDVRCLLVSRFFFFSSRRRHTRCSRDWSSDVCSSDLEKTRPEHVHVAAQWIFKSTTLGCSALCRQGRNQGLALRFLQTERVKNVAGERESGVEGKRGELGGGRII